MPWMPTLMSQLSTHHFMFCPARTNVHRHTRTYWSDRRSRVPRSKSSLYDTPRCTGACSAAVYQKVYKTAAGNAIVAMMGTVPGYFFTVAFVDVLGRIPIQFAGERPEPCATPTLIHARH